jgi:hypothetical protein
MGTGCGSVHWRMGDNRARKEVIVLTQIGLLSVGVKMGIQVDILIARVNDD